MPTLCHQHHNDPATHRRDDGHAHAGRAKFYAQSDAGIERIRRRHRREQYYCREKTHSSSAARVALLTVQ